MKPPHPRIRRARTRQLAALTSGFVAALALATSFYNVYLQRRQIQAQVWPHLEWSYSYKGDDFTLTLANTGVGPAKIARVWVTLDGTPVTTWKEAFDRAASGDPALETLLKQPDLEFVHSSVGRRVLGAGVAIQPIEFHRPHGDGGLQYSLEPLVGLYERLRVEICYCSTLDECELMRERKPVSKCAAPSPEFEN
jgi:hypothetical protein